MLNIPFLPHRCPVGKMGWESWSIIQPPSLKSSNGFIASEMTSRFFPLASKAIADLTKPLSLAHLLISLLVCASPYQPSISQTYLCVTHLRASARMLFPSVAEAPSCSPKSALSTVIALQPGSARVHFPASLAVGTVLLSSSVQQNVNRYKMFYF